MSFRVHKRRFVCVKCGAKSSDDYLKLSEIKAIQEKHGVKIETEFIDLCKVCFKEEVSNYTQTSIISKGIADRKISEEDLIKLNENPKYKIQIFKKLEHKKGWLKEKKRLMIDKLLAETEYDVVLNSRQNGGSVWV